MRVLLDGIERQSSETLAHGCAARSDAKAGQTMVMLECPGGWYEYLSAGIDQQGHTRISVEQRVRQTM